MIFARCWKTSAVEENLMPLPRQCERDFLCNPLVLRGVGEEDFHNALKAFKESRQLAAEKP